MAKNKKTSMPVTYPSKNVIAVSGFLLNLELPYRPNAYTTL